MAMMALTPMIISAIGHTGFAVAAVASSRWINPTIPAPVRPMAPRSAPLLLQRLYRKAATNTVGSAINADDARRALVTVML